MPLFKEKRSSFQIFGSLIHKIITSPELFPTDISLTEQHDFSVDELLSIRKERYKLAIVYAKIYLQELNKTRKVATSSEQLETAYGQAFMTVFSDSDINFEELGIDPNEFIETIDPYTFYVAMHQDEKHNDPYYLAFNHFSNIVFEDKAPLAAITLGKYIREEVSKSLVNDLLSRYKIV